MNKYAHIFCELVLITKNIYLNGNIGLKQFDCVLILSII